MRPYIGYHQAEGPASVHRGLPDTALTLVLAFDEPLDVAWSSQPRSRDRHWAMVSGLHTEPALIRHAGCQHGIQLALTPAGARALLRVPAAELGGHLVPLDAVLGGAARRMYDDVAQARSWQGRFELLDRHLVGLLPDHLPALRAELGEAWRRLQRDPRIRIGRLAADLGWSRRHLSAAFDAEFGLAPKDVARLVRLRTARERMVQGAPLAEVAVASGFSDQPHLTREWRALAGCTPGEWLREELPFIQDPDGTPASS